MLQVQIQTATADKQAYQRNAQKILEKLKANDMELIEATLEYAVQIFKSNETPLKKLLVLRLIKDAIVIKSPKFINKYIQNRELMKKMTDFCQHKLGDSNPDRGQDLFQGQDPQSSSEFLRTALELTEHLATTFPKDNKGAPTKFKIQFDELIEMGVKFPPRSQIMNPFDPQKEEPQSANLDRKEIDRTMLELNKTKQTIYEDITMINETLQNETDMGYINEVLVTYSESMGVTQQTFDPLVFKARSYEGVLNEDEVSELYTLQEFVAKFQKFYNTYLSKVCTPEAFKELKNKTLDFIKKILSKDFDNPPPLSQQQKQQKKPQQYQQFQQSDEDLELLKAIKESEIAFAQSQKQLQQEQQKKQQQEFELKQKKEEEERKELQRRREQERIEQERIKEQKRIEEENRVQIQQNLIRQQELQKQKQIEEQQRQEILKREAKEREEQEKKQKLDEQYWNNPFGQQQSQIQQQQQKSQLQQFNSSAHYQTPGNDDNQFTTTPTPFAQTQTIQKYPSQQFQQAKSYFNDKSQLQQDFQTNSNVQQQQFNTNAQSYQFEQIHSSSLAQQPNNQQYLYSQFNQQMATPQGGGQYTTPQAGGSQYLQSQLREPPMNKINSGVVKKYESFEVNFDNLSVSTSTKPKYPLNMDQQIQIKKYTGKLVEYDNTQFDILHTFGLTDSQKKRFKIASLKGKAALVNSPQVQIGIVQALQYVPLKEKNYLKLSLFIGNKTQSPFDNCKLVYEGDNKQFLIWLKPEKIQERIEPGQQISQEIICIFKQHQNYRLVNVHFQGQWANKAISTNFFLTTTLVSFMEFKDISLSVFRLKWKQRKEEIFKSETFLLNPKIVKTGYYLKKLFPKLCEYAPFQQFQDQQLDYFNDRQLRYISYKLCGIFELTNVNQNYMIKFIILPNMHCTIKIVGNNEHLCRQMLSTLNWILGLE